MQSEELLGGAVRLFNGDSREVLKTLPDNSVDSVTTDPPYALVSIARRYGNEVRSNLEQPADKDLSTIAAGQYARLAGGFMGQKWDTGETAFAIDFWREVLRVLKPGGHVIAFSGTRTYHRLACAIEDAGFEIRDMVSWLYGSGFPKSHDVAKSIDKAARGVPHGGADPTSPNHGKFKGGCSDDNEAGRGFGAGPGHFMAAAGESVARKLVNEAAEWEGWGTALKPACEPCVLARKPLIGTVAGNVLARGTGAINIDACRIPAEKPTGWGGNAGGTREVVCTPGNKDGDPRPVDGRWPANVVHDGSDEVVAGFPFSKSTGGTGEASRGWRGDGSTVGAGLAGATGGLGDEGSAARFFYSAKADAMDRVGTKHPTVKPVDLMEWMVRLITPPGGVTLDPFAGSGTTGEAAFRQGFKAILIEREAAYCEDIRRRMELANAGDKSKRRAIAKVKAANADDAGPGALFA